MKQKLDNNTIYYTIIDKNKLDIEYDSITNSSLESLQGKCVLNLMLKELDIEQKPIYKTSIGKPYYKDSNIFFNYSHSKNYIACAIANFDIGIDIEQKDREINNTMVKICSFNEETKLQEFVSREAFCKLTGKGLNAFFDKSKSNSCSNKIIDNDNYICSICSFYTSPRFKFINIK